MSERTGTVRSAKRRSVLKSIGGGAVIGTMTVTASGRSSVGQDDEIRLGLLEPMTGPFAALGEERRNGGLLAIEAVNESDEFDFEIAYDTYDTEAEPSTGVLRAEEAVDGFGAEFLTGAISSSVALAINEAAMDWEVLYVPGAADDRITHGEDCGEYIFRYEPSVAQNVGAMAEFTADELDTSVWYHVADYAYGHAVRERADERLTELDDDYEVIGETESEFGATDFEAFITDMMGSEAETAIVGMTGGDLVAFLRQAARRDMAEEMNLMTTTASFRAVWAGAEGAADQVYSGVRYLPTLETGYNLEFVERYRDEYDDPPDNFACNGYESVMMTARGIQAALDEEGAAGPDVVKDVLPGLEAETVKGTTMFRECDHQALTDIWVGQLHANGDDVDVEILHEVTAEEAIPPCEDVECDLA